MGRPMRGPAPLPQNQNSSQALCQPRGELGQTVSRQKFQSPEAINPAANPGRGIFDSPSWRLASFLRLTMERRSVVDFDVWGNNVCSYHAPPPKKSARKRSFHKILNGLCCCVVFKGWVEGTFHFDNSRASSGRLEELPSAFSTFLPGPPPRTPSEAHSPPVGMLDS